ncbi:MAG: methyltransferase domain-containing protein [Motiliproteus sp.]|nr:methyltransferase domain-containing protein [Motiliproteus sp.]MCW9052439.1 methyltransferase domain-containing protein [Motiliproteus sp.]
MSAALQNKWDKRYQNASESNQPAQVLKDNLHLIPNHGRALELACGLGGNALLLAQQGLEVDAWDLSSVAINKLNTFAQQRGVNISAQQRDIEQAPLPSSSYDLICVSAFLERSLCPSIIEALRPGGLLFYQTFTQLKTQSSGPSNSAFLLERGELLSLFVPLNLVAYREEQDCGDLGKGLRNQAYLVARKA